MKVCRYLVESKADVNAENDGYKPPPLHAPELALENGCVLFCFVLFCFVLFWMFSLFLCYRRGRTVLSYAISNGHKRIAEYLEGFGARMWCQEEEEEDA